MEGDSSYDKISSFYNLISGPFESRYRIEAIKIFSPGKGESLLEIGFGTGHNLSILARAVGPEGHITGLDKSRKMFDLTERKIKKQDLTERVTIHCRDALAYPFPVSAFDGAFMSFTLETFTDDQIQSLLENIHRTLKKGSRLTILSMSESDRHTLIYRMYLCTHNKFPRIVDCRPINTLPMLIRAGFSIIEEKKLHLYGLPVTIISAKT